MKFTVPVYFEFNVADAEYARQRAQDMLDARGLKGVVGSPHCMPDPPPELTAEMRHYLGKEIEYNEGDGTGYVSDLDYAKEEMGSGKNIVNNSGYGGADPEGFTVRFKQEFDALYAKYGGGTKLAFLLNPLKPKP